MDVMDQTVLVRACVTVITMDVSCLSQEDPKNVILLLLDVRLTLGTLDYL